MHSELSQNFVLFFEGNDEWLQQYGLYLNTAVRVGYLVRYQYFMSNLNYNTIGLMISRKILR
jgi:hypothetical protein